MKKATIKPHLDFVLVLPDPIKEVTDGGIFLPSASKEKLPQGTVIAVGDGVFASNTGVFIPTTVKKGSHVLHGKHGTTEIKIEGETYLLMKEGNIQAIL